MLPRPHRQQTLTCFRDVVDSGNTIVLNKTTAETAVFGGLGRLAFDANGWGAFLRPGRPTAGLATIMKKHIVVAADGTLYLHDANDASTTLLRELSNTYQHKYAQLILQPANTIVRVKVYKTTLLHGGRKLFVQLRDVQDWAE